MLKSGLCDYSDAYILGKGTTFVIEAGATDETRAKIIKKWYLKIVYRLPTE